MKSVKMFGKKIPILAVFLAMLLLVGTAAIAVPANADTQTVTGTTVIPYIVTTDIGFGSVVAGSTTTVVDIITAGGTGNTIQVNTVLPAGTNSDILETLTYIEGTAEGATPATLPIWNDDGTVTTWVAIVLDAGEQLSMEALAGAVVGTWPTITITFTVS